jgi:hypothetical protein
MESTTLEFKPVSTHDTLKQFRGFPLSLQLIHQGYTIQEIEAYN